MELTSTEIREIRTNAGKTQAEFCYIIIGVSKKTVEGWEYGIRHPRGSARKLIVDLKNQHSKN